MAFHAGVQANSKVHVTWYLFQIKPRPFTTLSRPVNLSLTSASFLVFQAKGVIHSVKYDCCPNEPYQNLKITLKLQRSRQFFNYMLVVPGIILGLLVPLQFLLPPSSTHRSLFGRYTRKSYFSRKHLNRVCLLNLCKKRTIYQVTPREEWINLPGRQLYKFFLRSLTNEVHPKMKEFLAFWEVSHLRVNKSATK